jgi:hypothetical protein
MLDMIIRLRRSNNKVSYFGAARAFFYENENYNYDIHNTIYAPFLSAARQYEKVSHLMRHSRFTKTVAEKFGVS